MLCSDIKTTSVMAGTKDGLNDLRLPRMPLPSPTSTFVPVGYESGPPIGNDGHEGPDGIKSPGSEVRYLIDPTGKIWLQHGQGQTPYLHSYLFAVGVRQWTDLIYQVADETGIPPAVIAGVMSYRSGGDASSKGRAEPDPDPGEFDDPFQDSVDPSGEDPGDDPGVSPTGGATDPSGPTTDPVFLSSYPAGWANSPGFLSEAGWANSPGFLSEAGWEAPPSGVGLLHLDRATAAAYSGIPEDEITEERLFEPAFNLIYGSRDIAYILNSTPNLIAALAYLGRGEGFDPYLGVAGGTEALALIGSINQAIEYGFSGMGSPTEDGQASSGWMGASLLLWASIGGLLLGLGAKGAR